MHCKVDSPHHQRCNPCSPAGHWHGSLGGSEPDPGHNKNRDCWFALNQLKVNTQKELKWNHVLTRLSGMLHVAVCVSKTFTSLFQPQHLNKAFPIVVYDTKNKLSAQVWIQHTHASKYSTGSLNIWESAARFVHDLKCFLVVIYPGHLLHDEARGWRVLHLPHGLTSVSTEVN